MTRFSVIESVQHLIAQYRSFIRSSYRLADPSLRAQFEGHVNQADVLVKGPYVTLSRDFAEALPLDHVLASGCGHPQLGRLHWPFGANALFAHQEASLRSVEAGRNVIVKTGTGSGKTEAFLLPVLSGVLRLKEQGIAGTKAILLYPMNALANDQLVRLRELIRDSGSGITFALYTGDSQTVAAALGEPVTGHELTQREAIRNHPPDILLTNYKQLEFLLVRKADRPLFTPSLRFVVLDEIHSYRGALATEVACLLRRLKARCGLERGELRAIGTSATVSQDAGGDVALARFASDLCDESFEQADIIGERYRDVPVTQAPYDPPVVELSDQEIAFFGHESEDGLVRLAEKLCGRKAVTARSTVDKLRDLLQGNRFVEALDAFASSPRSLDELAQEIKERLPRLGEVPDDVVVRMIKGYLLVGSFGDDAEAPVLRPKLHTFFHGVYDVGLCMNPGCRTLSTDGSDRCAVCASAVRPAVLCRTCGQDFVKVHFDEDHPSQTIANDEFLSDDKTAFITPQLVGERGEAEEGSEANDDGEEPPRPRGKRRTAAQLRLQRKFVDHVRGMVFDERPDDVPPENLSEQHVMRGRGTTCPVCNSRYSRGDILTLLRTGVRRRRAVSFDFYQSYLDPKRTPWSWLTADPYNLSIAEHERGATFFMLDRPEALRSRALSGIKMEPLVKDSERGALGGIAKLVYEKAGLGNLVGEEWTREVIALLRSPDYEILESPPGLPERVRSQLAGMRPLQIAKRVIRLVKAERGWRCRKCAIWRPYRVEVCLATTACSGRAEDIQQSETDRENYYVDLYTSDRPRRLRAVEHTAQIDQETRARREQDFKDGRIEALVCSPTLELGVNIGSLYSVLMRNAPHAPANYVQRAGRAGRRMRIGFVTTFCGVGAHDRYCFEDPAWLVRGEFRPPIVRLTNDKILARHVRSFALEELNEDFSWMMGDLLEDLQNPAALKRDRYAPLLDALQTRGQEIADRAVRVFDQRQDAAAVVHGFPATLEEAVAAWHQQVIRLHREFHEFARIVSTRESEQKRRARERAYRELTTDREKAFVLSYLSDTGVLPSYQFPTDTFSLDPGVSDTPTLRRPAWIALFEFAPGNMVYANGHKLKSIRAFFEGSRRAGPGERGADQSGRVERFCFCNSCDFAAQEAVNNCPRCGAAIRNQAEVALIDSFEAEENTQITSAEDSRQRLTFKREEHLLDNAEGAATLYPYEFVTLEFRTRANLLVTNWGRQLRRRRCRKVRALPELRKTPSARTYGGEAAQLERESPRDL